MSHIEGRPEVGGQPRRLTKSLIKGGYTFYDLIQKDKRFYSMLMVFFLIAGATYPYPAIAMWVGFFFAGYSAIANDSIQTIGTFLASNRQRPWWLLWLFIGLVFLATVGYSWVVYSGDVSHQRLSAKGFSEAPTQFNFLQIAAPLFLLALTRMKIPVSTTFLILSCFATSAASLTGVLTKSLLGYVCAFVVSIIIWRVTTRNMDRWFKSPAGTHWMPIQWLATGVLWYSWLSQDASNIAVYLPRSLSGEQFAIFAGAIFVGLGVLFYMRGDRIQQIVEEKTALVDVRAATIIDFIYAGILITFKNWSHIPMSTTWVFIGLLAGRELGIALARQDLRRRTWRLMYKDLRNATIGLVVSAVVAFAANPEIFIGKIG